MGDDLPQDAEVGVDAVELAKNGFDADFRPPFHRYPLGAPLEKGADPQGVFTQGVLRLVKPAAPEHLLVRDPD